MQNFNAHIKGSKPVIVDFYADWCGPCKLMTPILHELKGKLGERVTILKLDVDKNPEYARMYKVQAVPTLIIFKEGNVIWRNSGVTPANEILKRLSTVIQS